eukprot:CAMPEP_0119418308 /NCGR_PEP_ID=MMETSP1335-20130426/17918_1 /TAXON_ID=259385 /ORGANISM="Chrysoculter rhomboideus, Strain RCC1486" /LENGTH=141 /DNA_ID=CAMNT_0007443541 /DNA_START=192 /DNA_END=613 /DNA_ORIENTATION=+
MPSASGECVRRALRLHELDEHALLREHHVLDVTEGRWRRPRVFVGETVMVELGVRLRRAAAVLVKQLADGEIAGRGEDVSQRGVVRRLDEEHEDVRAREVEHHRERVHVHAPNERARGVHLAEVLVDLVARAHGPQRDARR